MHGTVTDLVTRKPLQNAVVDIWQASANGKYDFQDPENQTDNNLRGKFKTNAEGKYYFYCLRPTPYSLPTDGMFNPYFQYQSIYWDPYLYIINQHTFCQRKLTSTPKGPAGVLLKLLDRHPMRPAHIHIMVTHPDHKPVTTQIFPSDDPYITSDTVFAVKDDLVVEFVPLEGDPKASLQMEYNFVLASNDTKGAGTTRAAAGSDSARL